jgi:hypothetical protein
MYYFNKTILNKFQMSNCFIIWNMFCSDAILFFMLIVKIGKNCSSIIMWMVIRPEGDVKLSRKKLKLLYHQKIQASWMFDWLLLFKIEMCNLRSLVQ